MHRHNFLVPTPWGGAKRSSIIKSELQSQFQKIFKPNFVYLITNERYITFQTGFSFGPLVHAQGWDLGYCGGGFGGQFFFPKFNQIWCVSYLNEWHMHRHNFFGPHLLGPWEGSKLNFLNMVIWHIKFKGMSIRPGYTEKI